MLQGEWAERLNSVIWEIAFQHWSATGKGGLPCFQAAWVPVQKFSSLLNFCGKLNSNI